MGILEEFLSHDDAQRAAEVMPAFCKCALTGSIALETQLISHGLAPRQRRLNDLDYVIGGFDSIPCKLADRFLVHHIHPQAPPGKLLLQLVDPARRLRIDVFRAFGASMSRANTIHETSPESMRVLSIEDLAARFTTYVWEHLREGRAVERKHAESFQRLAGIDTFITVDLEAAWQDHRQSITESFFEARERTNKALQLHPELLFEQTYSEEVEPCYRCQDQGPFHRAEPSLIVNSLGYW